MEFYFVMLEMFPQAAKTFSIFLTDKGKGKWSVTGRVNG